MCWTAQSSAKKGPAGLDLPSCRRGRQVTREFATSRLGHPFLAERFVSIGRVVEVRLDGRRRSPRTVRDLLDREALELAVMARQGDCPATLENPIGSSVRRLARHTVSRYPARLAFSSRSPGKCERTGWTSYPR